MKNWISAHFPWHKIMLYKLWAFMVVLDVYSWSIATLRITDHIDRLQGLLLGGPFVIALLIGIVLLSLQIVGYHMHSKDPNWIWNK